MKFRAHGFNLGAWSLVLFAATWAGSFPAYAAGPISTTYNTYGEIGLLDMPSAHMAPDGELAFTVGDVGSTQRYVLSFQALPWLDASFRYSHIVGLFRGYNNYHYYDRSFGFKVRLASEGTIMPDVSLGIRDLLGTGIYSSEYLTASKHLGDFDLTAGLGWGRLADNATLSNPFGLIFASFNTRNSSTTVTGGTVNFKQFFHGPKAGVFGGLAWQTPVDGLKVLAEYSSDQYTVEAKYPGGIKARTPVNVGLTYRPYDALALSAGWFYGTTYGFAISLSGDTTSEPGTVERIGPAVPAPVIRDTAQQQQALLLMADQNPWPEDAVGRRPHMPSGAGQARQNLIAALLSEGRGVRDIDFDGNTLVVDAQVQGDAHTQCAKYAQIASAAGSRFTSIAMSDLQEASGTVTFCPIAVRAKFVQSDGEAAVERMTTPTALVNRLRADMAKQALTLEALSTDTSELWLYYQNGRYRDESEAIGRIVRLLMADAPPSIEIFHLVAIAAGMPAQTITVARSAFERTLAADGLTSLLGDAITVRAAPLDNPALERMVLIPYPRFSWSADPKLTEHVFDPDVPLQFQFFAQLEGDAQIGPGLTFASVLTGNIWNNLTFSRPAGSALPHVRTDLLKYAKEGANGISFLGGIYQTRLAPNVFAEVKAGYLEDMFMGAGGDVLWRPEGSRFAVGFDVYQVWKRDFNRLFGIQSYNILTGHASIYYRSPWYGLNFKVHVGRYLAGDYGATFEVTRRFSTGVEVGFFATLTNVPFHKFGEGSFDKGIFIHIPFEWGLPIFSQSSYDLHLSSLTRDGGQRLSNDDSLYSETQRTSDGEITQHLDEVIAP